MVVDEAVLVFRILLNGFVTNLAWLSRPVLWSAEAMRFAMGEYWQLDWRFTHAIHGLARSHLVLRSTHSRHESVGLFRFCFVRGDLASRGLRPGRSAVILPGLAELWEPPLLTTTRRGPGGMAAPFGVGAEPGKGLVASSRGSCATCIVPGRLGDTVGGAILPDRPGNGALQFGLKPVSRIGV